MMAVMRGIELGEDRPERRIGEQFGGAQVLVGHLLLVEGRPLVLRGVEFPERRPLLLEVVVLGLERTVGSKRLFPGLLQLGPFGVREDRFAVMVMVPAACGARWRG